MANNEEGVWWLSRVKVEGVAMVYDPDRGLRAPGPVQDDDPPWPPGATLIERLENLQADLADHARKDFYFEINGKDSGEVARLIAQAIEQLKAE